MELLKGLLALAVVLGVPFLLLCARGAVIVYLLGFIKPGKSGSDWIWSPDIYKEDNNKK